MGQNAVIVIDFKKDEKELFDYIAQNNADIPDSIKKEKVLTPETEEKLKAVLADFSAKFWDTSE